MTADRDIVLPAEVSASELRRWRRLFHAYPEPGFCEFHSAAVLVEELTGLGYKVLTGAAAMDRGAPLRSPDPATRAEWAERALRAGARRDLIDDMKSGGTAVVAELGTGDSPVVAFRFDMDALPITESTDAAHHPVSEGYTSQWPGWMHACAHDGHMAIGLGIAHALRDLAGSGHGTLRLIFQPAEEGAPGGAQAIVARGHLDDVDALICAHLGLGARSGEVVCRTSFMATSKYRVSLRGRSSHVVLEPHLGRNALLAAASASLAIHGIAPHPDAWFNVNVGILRAGTEQGVTAADAELELGIWAETNDVLAYARGRVMEVLNGVAAAYDVAVEVTHIGDAPSADQDVALADLCRQAAEESRYVEAVTAFRDCKAGEDATVLLARVGAGRGRGVYLLIGSDLPSSHHTAAFDIDEQALSAGVDVMARVGARVLQGAS